MRAEVKELLNILSELALKGPIPAIGKGSPAVGMTLLGALNIPYRSTDKPRYKGIVVNGRRRAGGASQNRVNLFAKVPNWNISECKSSAEIVDRYGYETPDGQKLFCTVSANRVNSQGLFLRINKAEGLLQECAQKGKEVEVFASWSISDLRKRLVDKHPETIWVEAVTTEREGKEFFHYRDALYTSSPKVEILEDLIDEGTITMDHLIETKNGRTIEKGPLFKIKPSNISALFPKPLKFDLFSI